MELDEMTEAIVDASVKLQARRTALIPAAVIGKIDVWGLAESEAA